MPASQSVDWSFFRTARGPRRKSLLRRSYELRPSWAHGVDLLDLEREARQLVFSFNGASRIHRDMRSIAQARGHCIDGFRHYDYRLSIQHSRELLREHSFILCVEGPGMPQSFSNPWLESCCRALSRGPIARISVRASPIPGDGSLVVVGEPLSCLARMKPILSISLLRLTFYSLMGAAALASLTILLRVALLALLLLFPIEIQLPLEDWAKSLLSTATLIGESFFLASTCACALTNAFGFAQRCVDRESLAAELRLRLLHRARELVAQSPVQSR